MSGISPLRRTSSSDVSRGRRFVTGDRYAVGALTALAFLLRLYRCTHQSLWVDEAFSIKYARLYESMTWEKFFYDLHGPLHAVLLRGVVQWLGDAEIVLRGFEVVLGTLTVPVFYWALRPLGRRTVALVATALLAVSPYHIWYSQEVRNYALFILTGILATGAFLRLLVSTEPPVRETGAAGPAPTRVRSLAFAAYGVLNFAGFLSNLAHLFTLAAHGAVQLFRRHGRRLWIGMIASWAITLLLLSPWIALFWERHVEVSGALEFGSEPKTEKLRGETSAPALGIPYTYFVYSVGYSLGPSPRELRDNGASAMTSHWGWMLWCGLAFGGIGLLGAARLTRRGACGRAWLWLLILPVLLTYGTALRNLKVFNPRYASAAFPAYLLALAEGVTSPRSRRGQLALGIALLVPTGASLAHHYHDPHYAKDDARSAVRAIRDRAQPGDLVFVIGTDEPLARYYWRDIREGSGGITKGDIGYWWDRTRKEKIDLLEDSFRSHPNVFVLFLRDHFVDPDGFWRDYIREHHPPRERFSYPGTELWIIEPESALDSESPPVPGSASPRVTP